MTNFDDVGHFHERFGLHNTTHHVPGPRPSDEELLRFRIEFMKEELGEFIAASRDHDHVGMFDALLDLAYVAMGTAHLLGYPWQAGWDAVQGANMRKVRAASDGSDSKRDSAFDVVKPVGWTPPDIAGVLRSVGFELTPVERSAPCCPGCNQGYNEMTLLELYDPATGMYDMRCEKCNTVIFVQSTPS